MSTLCGVCTERPPKYKCPSCEIRYCSLNCFKVHKPVHETPDDPTTDIVPSSEAHLSQPSAPFLASATLPQSSDDTPFNALLSNHTLQHLLQRHPGLRSQLQRIYASTLEPSSNDVAPASHSRGNRGYRGGYRGRGRGRGRGDGRPRGPWKQEAADKGAVRQILRVQNYEGESGDGMKEFVALTQKLYGENVSVEKNQDTDFSVDR
ncbi:uncharacterized protein K452DRAFT_268675 [Aplosporella prunicola CBS 121167]|uniref:HIT-type domain-containing protein n=1 Tax=Aplosporella prunicola CBS 121167 TaxID=1176127 RepID=A0A6A6BJ11_9PEZI|nr:uncharacterized protein K452DRAFT_268675 [Aplosporella prunicola CBS 121167]KAF2143285.1 hypothetical protein K452DRAFT_268675 [Aplosporella prunicola CBS 121167]